MYLNFPFLIFSSNLFRITFDFLSYFAQFGVIESVLIVLIFIFFDFYSDCVYDCVYDCVNEFIIILDIIFFNHLIENLDEIIIQIINLTHLLFFQFIQNSFFQISDYHSLEIFYFSMLSYSRSIYYLIYQISYFL